MGGMLRFVVDPTNRTLIIETITMLVMLLVRLDEGAEDGTHQSTR